MKKYVIYITEYLGDKLPRWYIGSTFKDNIIKNNYNGSPRSKKWKTLYEEEQTLNRHLFKTEIIYECYDREAAIDIERKFQVHANAIERDDYMNMSYAGGSFGKCNLTTPESIAKGLETKRKNGTLGSTKESSKKGVETKRKNGTLKQTKEAIEKYKKSMTLEDGTWNNNSEKRLKTVLTPNENGVTIAKIGGQNMRNTRMNKIDENGLNDFQIAGTNHSIRMNTILKNGETEAKRRGKITSFTRKELGLGKGSTNSKAKKINIYNGKDELMFECHGNFKEICSENNLPFKSLANSYRNDCRKLYITCLPNNKEYIPFTGWYSKEVKC